MAMTSESALGRSDQSIEYKTIVKCASSILDCIKSSPNSIGTAMFAEGYISEYVRDSVGDTSVSKVDKAQQLLNTITDRVKTDPLAYNGFVEIIRNEGTWACCYLEQLQKVYEELSLEAQQIEQCSSDSDDSLNEYCKPSVFELVEVIDSITVNSDIHIEIVPVIDSYQLPRSDSITVSDKKVESPKAGKKDNHQEEVPPIVYGQNGIPRPRERARARKPPRVKVLLRARTRARAETPPTRADGSIQGLLNESAPDFEMYLKPNSPPKVSPISCSKTDQIMDHHDSYHSDISGEEAEFRLKAFQTRSYLTRYSTNHKQYILSVYQPVLRGTRIKHETKHFTITFKHGDRKIYKITDREFDSLEEMLKTYESEKIDHSLPNIGRMVSMTEYCRLRQRQIGQEPQEMSLQNYIEQELPRQQNPQGNKKTIPRAIN